MMGLAKEFELGVVHRDELMDLRAEFGGFVRQLDELRLFKEKIGQNCVNDHYALIINQHSLQET